MEADRHSQDGQSDGQDQADESGTQPHVAASQSFDTQQAEAQPASAHGDGKAARQDEDAGSAAEGNDAQSAAGSDAASSESAAAASSTAAAEVPDSGDGVASADDSQDDGDGANSDSAGDDVNAQSSDDASAASPEASARRERFEAPADTAPRRKHHVAPALIALDRVDVDITYRVRPEGEVDLLATDIARVGQLFPVEVRLKPPDRFQIICGFRRVKALRMLHRDKVLARLHTDLSDEDALLMALAAAIHQAPVEPSQLTAVRERLDSEGRLTALLADMLDKALNPDQQLEPEQMGDEQEIDADELATNTAAKLGEINQDLALLADVFASLDDEKKLELLKQLRYSSELVAYLENI